VFDHFAATVEALPGDANPGTRPAEYAGDRTTAALAVARLARFDAGSVTFLAVPATPVASGTDVLVGGSTVATESVVTRFALDSKRVDRRASSFVHPADAAGTFIFGITAAVNPRAALRRHQHSTSPSYSA
jgi:hypothetical protein